MEEANDVEDEPQQNLARTAEPRCDKVSANCFNALLSSLRERSYVYKWPMHVNLTIF